MSTDTVNYLLRTMTGDPKEISNEELLSNTDEVGGVLVELGKTSLKEMQKIQPQGFLKQQDDYNEVVLNAEESDR